MIKLRVRSSTLIPSDSQGWRILEITRLSKKGNAHPFAYYFGKILNPEELLLRRIDSYVEDARGISTAQWQAYYQAKIAIVPVFPRLTVRPRIRHGMTLRFLQLSED